jgi:hypothetical protein
VEDSGRSFNAKRYPCRAAIEVEKERVKTVGMESEDGNVHLGGCATRSLDDQWPKRLLLDHLFDAAGVHSSILTCRCCLKFRSPAGKLTAMRFTVSFE